MDSAAGAYKTLLSLSGVPAKSSEMTLERAMLDASIDCIKVITPEGKLLHMNRAGCLALGVPIDSEFGMPWIPLLPESVHELGLEAIEKAGQGQNARFPGHSEINGEVQYWDNLLTPIMGSNGKAQVILCVARDVTVRTRLEGELAKSIEREQLLSQEMRHRIKNVFAVVSGLISLSEKEVVSSDSQTAPFRHLRGKLNALSRASDATFSSKPSHAGQQSKVDVEQLVSSVFLPFEGRFLTKGPVTNIQNQYTTVISLLLYELATNSVKYGAFSSDKGRVLISWEDEEPALRLFWQENGGPSLYGTPERQGFGSDMIARLVKSVGGEIELAWKMEGFRVTLVLPH